MELKVSSWMQDGTLTEAAFKDDYHHALKHITKDSSTILEKLSAAAEVPSITGKTSNGDPVPAAVMMPKLKKM